MHTIMMFQLHSHTLHPFCKLEVYFQVETVETKYSCISSSTQKTYIGRPCSALPITHGTATELVEKLRAGMRRRVASAITRGAAA